MDVASGSKPTGKYAERMLVGAWPESDPADLYAQQQRWREMRDAARDQFHELRDNAAQLRRVLDGDGFDGLHRDRELVARNFDFLGETRDDASRIWEHAGDAAGVLRKSMASTVRIVEQEITDIEMNPLLEDSDKQALIDALVEATNAQLIGQSAEAGAALASRVASHAAYMGSLPWHTSTADATPHTGQSGNNGTQMLNTEWKQAPVTGTGGAGSDGQQGANGGRGTGDQTSPQQGADAGKKPERGTGGDNTPKQDPSIATQPGRGTGGDTTPKQSPSTAPPAGRGTGGLLTPAGGPAPSSPVSLPGLGSVGGGGPSGGGLSGLGSGGLSPGGLASPPQGLLSATQLGAVPPVSAANPLSSAAAPAASGVGGGAPKASVPLVQAPPAQAVPAAAAPPAATPAGGSVQPAGMSSALPPPVAQPGAAPPASGTLGPAPALAGPPPPPAGSMAPVGPSAPAVPPPGVGAPPPFHSPLPPVGTPIIRGGLVERAEDPDIIRARQLIWELMWAGRRYPSLDWAIGVHRAGGDTGPTKFFITSSEGECYVPQHVHLPADPVLIPIFQDDEFVRPGWSAEWQGWVDPTHTVIEHHRLRAERFERPVLHAIVSSREISGVSHKLPAGVKLEVADPEKNPFVDTAKAQEIPEMAPGRAHRLATLSHDLYALVQKVPDSQRWSAAVDLAADAASATDERQVRTGLIVGNMPAPLSTDPNAAVLHWVIDELRTAGGTLDAAGWAQLQTAYWTAVMYAQSKRHTPQELTHDRGQYADAYRRARAYEGTWLLNAPPGPLPADWLADVAYTHLCATGNPERTRKGLGQRI